MQVNYKLTDQQPASQYAVLSPSTGKFGKLQQEMPHGYKAYGYKASCARPGYAQP